MAITQCLNGTYLSREEFQDNIILRYGVVPLNLPTDYDGYGKKFLVPHDLSCSKGNLVLERHNNAAKEWGDIVARALTPSCIAYKPKINIKTVQG